MNKDESTSRHLKPVHALSRWTGYKRLNFSAHRYRGEFQQCHGSKGTLCPRVSLRLLGDCRALIGPSTTPESHIDNGSFGS
jgi:hypothetical protein